MAIRKISDAERRARLAVRHHLARPASGRVTEAAADLIGFHATDPASVYLAAQARVSGTNPGDVARELYDERTLIRMLGMRRTMFVVPTELAPYVQHGCTNAVAARIRRTYTTHLEKAGVADDVAEWLTAVEDSVLNILRDVGEASGAQLSKAEPRLGTKISYAEGKKYGGDVSITSWVLNMMSADGRIVRGQPGTDRAKWTGSQYRWSPIERWLSAGVPSMPEAQARTGLLERWLTQFGPATIADIKWWTGWSLTDTKRALASVSHTEVDLDEQPGVVLTSDLEPVATPGPWVALLPALDPTAMGWAGRDWYLDTSYRLQLFDRSGNIGPSVWADGRIIGGWAQRRDGEIVYRLFEDVGAEHAHAIEAEAHRLATWHGEVRVIPRFRTPLERELTSTHDAT
jgi:hypothetical protein